MSIPLRFVVTTYNLWTDWRWAERAEAVRAWLRVNAPDILCLQELHGGSRKVLDEELAGHRRVHDAFPGWECESNIYWLHAMFELVAHGAEDIGMLEPARRLFWVRLRLKGRQETLLAATAHYTWAGHPKEQDSGLNPRIEQARRTAGALQRLAPADEAVLFMGDLNDSANPIRVLREAGLRDCYGGPGQVPRPTHPAVPMATDAPQVLDWQFYRGPLRVMNAAAVDFYHGGIAPSDHKPVTVTYGWKPEG